MAQTNRGGDEDVVTHAGLFPRDTLLAVSVAPMARHLGALKRTGLAALFQSTLDTVARERGFAQVADLGLGHEDLHRIMQAGFTVGLTGVGGTEPQWMLIANLAGHGEAVAKAIAAQHESLETRGAQIRADMSGETKVWTIHFVDRGTKSSYAVAGDRLFVADAIPTIEQALARAAAKPGATLHDSPQYVRFSEQCRAEGVPFVAVFANVKAGIALARTTLPAPLLTRVNPILDRLDLNQMSEFGLGLFASKGQLRDFTWVGYPTPRKGVLAALVQPKLGLPDDLHKMVSPTAVSASICTIHWANLYNEGLTLASTFDPNVPMHVSKLLGEVETHLGQDLDKKLIDLLGSHVVFQEWSSSTPTEGNWAVVLEVEQSRRFPPALKTLARKFGGQVTSVDKNPAVNLQMTVGSRDVSGLLFVHGDHLILANSPVTARRLMQDLDAGTGNGQVAQALAAFKGELNEADPLAFGWVDCARYSRHFLNQLALQLGHRELADRITAEVTRLGGHMTYSTRTTDKGVATRSASPYGNLYMTLTAAFLIRSHVEKANPSETIGKSDATEQQREILHGIVAAAQSFRDSKVTDSDGDGNGEFATLRALAERGLLDKLGLAATENPEIFMSGETLYRVHVPDEVDDREQSMIAFAWPAGKRTGTVLAAGPDAVVHSNSILAHVEGLASCDPRDYFKDGQFGGPRVGGWESTEGDSNPSTEVADKPRTTASPEEVKPLFDLLEKAELADEASPGVIELLENGNELVAARAAYAMGKIKVKEAVPQLCEIVRSHTSLEVQRQAMAALAKIRDVRSVRTAIDALKFKDPVVRSLAAQALGHMRPENVTNKILDVLSIPGKPDSVDRVAALVALADIGDAGVLIRAATSSKTPGPKEQQALTYLFQTLSSKYDATKESSTLVAVLDHPSDLLRKYAIQRLGVLKVPSTARALEGRLANETALQPLVKVSLNAVRGKSEAGDMMYTAKAQAERTWEMAQTWWKGLDDNGRYAVMGGGGVFLLLLMMVRRSRKRRRLSRERDHMVAMVAPSADLGHEDTGERDYGEVYDDYEEQGAGSGYLGRQTTRSRR